MSSLSEYSDSDISDIEITRTRKNKHKRQSLESDADESADERPSSPDSVSSSDSSEFRVERKHQTLHSIVLSENKSKVVSYFQQASEEITAQYELNKKNVRRKLFELNKKRNRAYSRRHQRLRESEVENFCDAEETYDSWAKKEKSRIKRLFHLAREKLWLQHMSIVNEEGKTSLHCAAESCTGLVKLLLLQDQKHFQCHQNSRDLEWKPLDEIKDISGGQLFEKNLFYHRLTGELFAGKRHKKLFSQSKEYTTIDLLMKKRRRVINLQDEDGNTALHIASAKGNTSAIYNLLKSGADESICNNHGNAPIDLAYDKPTRRMFVPKLLDSFFKSCPDKGNKHQKLRKKKQKENTKREKLENLKQLIDSGININGTYKSGVSKKSPLHVGAELGRVDIIEHLFGYEKCHLDVRDHKGWSALHYVAQGGTRGHLEVLDKLTALGAEIDLKSLNGFTALHINAMTVEKGVARTAMLQSLINNRFNLESKDSKGRTPFLLACHYGNIEKVIIFAINGCNIYATDNLGKNGLHYAYLKDHPDLAYVLNYLDSDSSKLKNTKDKRGKLPLFYLPTLTHKNRRNSSHRNTNSKKLNWHHPLCHCSLWELARDGDICTIKRLKQEADWLYPSISIRAPFRNTIDIFEKSFQNGYSLLHSLVIGNKKKPSNEIPRQRDNLRLLNFLLQKDDGAEGEENIFVDTSDKSGLTPLMHACRVNASKNVVSALIRHGASFTATDFGGNTVLHWAYAYDCRPIIDMVFDNNEYDDLKNITNKNGELAEDIAFYRDRVSIPSNENNKDNIESEDEETKEQSDNDASSVDEADNELLSIARKNAKVTSKLQKIASTM